MHHVYTLMQIVLIGTKKLELIRKTMWCLFMVAPILKSLVLFSCLSLVQFILYQDCPNGKLTPNTFCEMYKMFFPAGDAEKFCENVFRTFDADKSGTIDFKVHKFSVHIILSMQWMNLSWSIRLAISNLSHLPHNELAKQSPVQDNFRNSWWRSTWPQLGHQGKNSCGLSGFLSQIT